VQVFVRNQTPKPAQMKRKVPPAQRKTSRKQGEFEVPQSLWVDKVRRGINKILESGRVLTESAQADLRYCVDLISSTQDQKFAWNTSFYQSSGDTPNPTPLNLHDDPSLYLSMLPTYSENKQQDAHGNRRPQWVVGNHYLIQVKERPFYAIVRSTIAS
jgi:hypothetical protein